MPPSQSLPPPILSFNNYVQTLVPSPTLSRSGRISSWLDWCSPGPAYSFGSTKKHKGTWAEVTVPLQVAGFLRGKKKKGRRERSLKLLYSLSTGTLVRILIPSWELFLLHPWPDHNSFQCCVLFNQKVLTQFHKTISYSSDHPWKITEKKYCFFTFLDQKKHFKWYWFPKY